MFPVKPGFNETKRYRIPLTNTSPSSSTPASASQQHFYQLLLSPFTKNKIWDMWDPVWFKLGESLVYFISTGYLLLSIAVLLAFYHGSNALKFLRTGRDLWSKSYDPWKGANVLDISKYSKKREYQSCAFPCLPGYEEASRTIHLCEKSRVSSLAADLVKSVAEESLIRHVLL